MRPLRWGIFVCLVVSTAQGQTIRLSYDFRNLWLDGRWTGAVERIPGQPELPVVTARVLLPAGERLAAVSFEAASRSSRTQSFPIRTTPWPRPLCAVPWTDPAPSRFSPGDIYPARTVGDIGVVTLHGYRIATIPLYPAQLSPAERQAEVLPGLELTVRTEADPEAGLVRGLDSDRAEVAALVDNPDMLATYPVSRARASADYLVIAPKAYLDDTHADSLQALLDEKRSRGLVVVARSLEEVTSSETGRDQQEKVRKAIIRHYGEGVRYVLLVGNGHSILPTRKLKVNMNEGTIYSDFYFACLDGDFDNNKNNVFGETKDGPGGKDVDLACEVALGRAPVSSLDDMRAFVRKTLTLSSVAYYDPRIWRSLLFGEKLDNSTLGGKNLDQLEKGGKAGHLETVGYPSAAVLDKYYETFQKTYSASDVIAKLNSGEFYTVNHLGHANEDYCMRFSASRISELRNELPFFGITQGCHPGNLKGPNWASKMVTAPGGGAAAMIANSNYGWYSPGSADGPSNRFHLAFYDTVFRDGERQLGMIHYKTKTKMIPDVTSATIMRWVVYETNLLGDPELELRF